MKAKSISIIKTNPYLRDPDEMRKRIARSVDTSCRVEGIVTNPSQKLIDIPKRTEKAIFKSVAIVRAKR